VLRLHEPGALIPADDVVNAVSDGRVSAAWAGAGWFAGRDSAFNMFSSIPFGPGIGEYLGWLYYGGGLDLAREMFHRHGVHNIPCMLISPEASGWFTREIRTVEDLKGLRMRFFGLGAKAMEKLGVVTFQMPPGDIPAAFGDGTIDAAEFSLPMVDLPLGLDRFARYYYFPGWHQQATFFDLYINLERWRALPDQHQAVIEQACGDTIRDTIAKGEARQSQALREIQSRGVRLKRWSPEILAAFDKAWREVIAEESAANGQFRLVYNSYAAFRASYATWRYLSFL
jgi:TRAP-type mannitol/chloroaromatic compound transport system substrate-binding protein